MGWQKRVHISSASGRVSEIREPDLLEKIRIAFGENAIDVKNKALDAFNLIASIEFREKQNADCLDKTKLTGIVTALLGDKDVEIHIEAGGVGTL